MYTIICTIRSYRLDQLFDRLVASSSIANSKHRTICIYRFVPSSIQFRYLNQKKTHALCTGTSIHPSSSDLSLRLTIIVASLLS